MSAVRFVALVVCSVLACIAMVGCSPTAAYVAARDTETAAAGVVMTGYEAWRKYDHDHQEQILAASHDLASYKASVAAWRSGPRSEVDKAFATAKDGVIAFAQALDTASAVRAKSFAQAIGSVVALIATLTSVLNRYGIDLSKYGLKIPALLGGK